MLDLNKNNQMTTHNFKIQRHRSLSFGFAFVADIGGFQGVSKHAADFYSEEVAVYKHLEWLTILSACYIMQKQ